MQSVKKTKLSDNNICDKQRIITFAQRYVGYGISLQDLTNEKFSFSNSKQARFRIKQILATTVANKQTIDCLPVHLQHKIDLYNLTVKKLKQELDRKPTTLEIAKFLKVPTETILKLENIIYS